MSANGFFGGEFWSPTSYTGNRYASPKALRYAASATGPAPGASAGGAGDGPGRA